MVPSVHSTTVQGLAVLPIGPGSSFDTDLPTCLLAIIRKNFLWDRGKQAEVAFPA
ncbi:hypothetical protein QJS10_CPA05g01716 [Acorus calamus]|uniref:Uncharacterized protein n=1 Tax=Acorus calamus TaxID=4465 RepID=A0AAV9ESD2_ACOCL|nr:hypothetical protein QJS10_CPA05g01716 [Acorus calamus]